MFSAAIAASELRQLVGGVEDHCVAEALELGVRSTSVEFLRLLCSECQRKSLPFSK